MSIAETGMQSAKTMVPVASDAAREEVILAMAFSYIGLLHSFVAKAISPQSNGIRRPSVSRPNM
jgi:hypothetical protein